jgi:protein disulfide-isomerase A6
MIEASLNEIRKVANSRLGISGGDSGSSKQSGGGSKGGNEVVELTDANFDKVVMQSKDLWLVEFFAPW